MPHASSHYHVIVIGAGAAGASSALELARRGKRVLLLEQLGVIHARGSSHGHSRIFRFAYDEPDYARLAMRALKAWRSLEVEAGEALLTLTGGLDLGPSGNLSFENTARAMLEVGARFERLNALELNQRYPQWHVPEGWEALYSPDAGIVAPWQTVGTMVKLARARGADLLEHTPVQGLDLERGEVHTARGTFSGDQIVVAAGAWLPELLPELNLPLTVTLEHSLYFLPAHPARFQPEHFPIFIEHADLAYGFPQFGWAGVKVGLHQSGPEVQASSRALEVPSEAVERTQAWLEAFLPGENWRYVQGRTCLYTNTPGHDFLLDFHPHAPNVLLVSPCSGHGFKFAPLLGELVADKLEGRENPFLLERFWLGNVVRAAGGRLLARAGEG